MTCRSPLTTSVVEVRTRPQPAARAPASSIRRLRLNLARPRHSRGVSLVEMMVAVLVGVLLTIGLVDILATNKSSYVGEENFARMQESGRFAINTIARHLRQYGSLGCGSTRLEDFNGTLKIHTDDLRNGSTDTGALLISPNSPLAFDDDDDTLWANTDAKLMLPGPPKTRVIAGRVRGDVLATWGTQDQAALVTSSPDTSTISDMNATLTINRSAAAFQKDRYAVITDCNQSEVFKITSPDDPTTSGTTDLGHADQSFERAFNWSPDTLTNANEGADDSTLGVDYRAEVYPLDYSVFFICCVDTSDGTRTDNVDHCTNGDANYASALCQWSTAFGGITRQLATNIEDMRITWTADGATYTDASTGMDWGSVSGLRVELLLASSDAIRTQAVAPSALTGTDLGAGIASDRRRYEVISLSVGIRSRTPWVLDAWE